MDKNLDLVKERKSTHGSWAINSKAAQDLKAVVHASANYPIMPPQQREALDMICTKIGRIVSGNPLEVDHWNDLAGYAQLVAEYLQNPESSL